MVNVPSRYAFETPEFGLDDAGLHRLRSRFVFESLPYARITRAEVRRGKTVQNWRLLLAFGLACLSFALYVAYNTYRFFQYGHGVIYIQEIAVPVIPALIGGVASWQALQVADILVVSAGRRKLVFPLHTLKAGKVLALPAYLASRLENRAVAP